MKILDEFKAFLLRGNVVDLAVGVMIGAAFGNIVKAFTDGIVTPMLGVLGGNPRVSLHIWHFDVGMVFNAVLAFVITAAIIFFLIIKPMAMLLAMTRKKEAAAPPPPPVEVQLLTEIRDLLKK